jgi:hypothetical protein
MSSKSPFLIDARHRTAGDHHHGGDGREEHEDPGSLGAPLHRVRTLRDPSQLRSQCRVCCKPGERFFSVSFSFDNSFTSQINESSISSLLRRITLVCLIFSDKFNDLVRIKLKIISI